MGQLRRFLAETPPGVAFSDVVRPRDSVVRTAFLLTIKGGEVVDPSTKGVAYAGEVVGSAPTYQNTVKFGDAKAATWNPGRYTRLAVLFNFSYLAACRVWLFGAHGTNADNEAAALRACP